MHGRDSHVYRLKKALYRLKKSSRAWYSDIDSNLWKMGFVKNEADPNLYYVMVGEDPLICILYVDDILLTGS